MCQDSYRIRLLSRKAQRLSYPGLTGVSRARQILLDCPIKPVPAKAGICNDWFMIPGVIVGAKNF